MQNKMAGLLMESDTAFDKHKLHQKKYFADLMKSLQEVPESWSNSQTAYCVAAAGVERAAAVPGCPGKIGPSVKMFKSPKRVSGAIWQIGAQ
ncbi:MAG TPA: hypothetical protein VFE27_21860 [Acidobacteriaceae bacterium]|jgi:hypothetical protein|nr:hypothetical protein [Acidobacteriaceae bacterium]